MKVLLTGYAGLLGRHLARALKQKGFCIRVLLHQSTVTRKEFAEEVDDVIWGSIDDSEVVRNALKEIQLVVHSSWARSSPGGKRPTINETGTELLFKESVQAGVKAFSFISSIAVYGMKSNGKALITESYPFASGKEKAFIYPSEKINTENYLLSYDKKNTKLAIFRPGPIFDDKSCPVKKNIRVFGHSFGIGLGNGQNHMASIHAKDVADAVVRWLENGKDNAILNIVPTKQLLSKDWVLAWAQNKGFSIQPVFIPVSFIRLAGYGLKTLKKILGKQHRGDTAYAIACATRDLFYSNESLKGALGWTDKVTSAYTEDNNSCAE
jgi:nucleoside-diphosphate-sugar epimerase